VRPEDGILGIRRHLKLFANLRPVQIYPELLQASPIKQEILEGADFLVIRELTGGLYFGKPKKRWVTKTGRQSVDTLKYSEIEIRRIIQVAFELARGRRKFVTSVDKANVLETSRLWRQVATEIAAEYPDVGLEHMLVDTAAMQLVSNPKRFDVVVTENMFGDILTDEAAVISGSMGMLPSASLAGIPNLDEKVRTLGLYEPIHGSAPDIAGKGLANPTASILSAALMLRYSMSLGTEAAAIENAVSQVLNEGYRTADIAEGSSDYLSTTAMGSEILRRLK
jgi:3-isopropylmalate dehydrogenase